MKKTIPTAVFGCTIEGAQEVKSEILVKTCPAIRFLLVQRCAIWPTLVRKQGWRLSFLKALRNPVPACNLARDGSLQGSWLHRGRFMRRKISWKRGVLRKDSNSTYAPT